MPRAADVRVRETTVLTERVAYRAPMKFGGRVVTDAVLLHVSATIENRAGQTAVGRGSTPVGNAWAWPSAMLSTADTLAAMMALGECFPQTVVEAGVWGHPLEIGHAADRQLPALAARACAGRAEPMPRLAQLVAASPLHAALHDAHGRLHGQSAYQLLGPDHVNHDLAAYLGAEFAGEHLDRYVLPAPKPRMPLYHLVGALDPLVAADARNLVGDGLPETLEEWIARDGLGHLKIKLAGDDLAWDLQRVAAVESAAAAARAKRGVADWRYSLDFNERCPNVEYVLDFLAKLKELSPAALGRVHYIEQPTHRDLRAHPENRVHAAARIKPVVIDESLVDLESLLLAREQGYSGVALKACKGHGEALLMGAAAQKLNFFLCVQDLTCVGMSFLHSAGLAAHVPTVAAIEGNGRQYCPRGNEGWSERFPTMFQIRDGMVGTGALAGPGLGY